ncbi:EDD domain protein, DegV family [Acididesulfobacillus acetoxydans]|uniref:DegV domain-containing protein CPE0026 n=1 Tax=Acididesulfobacillus acetoxydans TaxID=1561005 RepID=A0A8S0XC30_9FIRM|nr:DegV family protein [Acididesulfobacillus acetoxydans]CAA7601926.1 EDD domain protein, DegV family [Acididesulfobacillus acetoxydans]CEJ08230.1 DegV domain-containing protein CPE0026 [Acididesulfobacillus acetoxydans]
MSLVILVDSSADIPRERAEAAGIEVVPMPVTIGGKTFFEGVDLSAAEFYAQFRALPELPKTSQPNPQSLLERYNKILAQGDEVVAIHLSSRLSSTWSTASMVREMTASPDKVHIVDSRGASFGYGLLALLAAERAKSCLTWEELEPQVHDLRDRMRYIFTPDTLEFLVKGGRVSRAAGMVGNLLDLKPLMRVTAAGSIEAFAKVRTRRAALQRLVQVMAQEAEYPEEQVIGISHSDCRGDAELLAEEVRRRLPIKDVWFSDIGCVIGSHTGPGTLALFYLSNPGN